LDKWSAASIVVRKSPLQSTNETLAKTWGSMGQHRLNRLPAIKVKTAPIGMHCDGGGLYLQVKRGSGRDLRRNWIFRYATGDKALSKTGKSRQVERQMGLGSVDVVPLGAARDRAIECRRLLLAGIDPIEAQRSERIKPHAA
jgi:Arm DNA-binding domain